MSLGNILHRPHPCDGYAITIQQNLGQAVNHLDLPRWCADTVGHIRRLQCLQTVLQRTDNPFLIFRMQIGKVVLKADLSNFRAELKNFAGLRRKGDAVVEYVIVPTADSGQTLGLLQ